jgi:hypothetical protein
MRGVGGGVGFAHVSKAMLFSAILEVAVVMTTALDVLGFLPRPSHDDKFPLMAESFEVV